MSKNQAQPPQYVLSGKISVQAVQVKDRILRRGRRHFSASTIECVAHFEFKSKSLQRAIYTLLWYFPLQHFTFTHTAHKTLFPHFLPSGGGGADPIMSTKYSNFPSSTQNIASLSSCVESSGVVSPAHLLIFCPVRLKHGAASMAAQPCDGPFKWASWGERLSRESHFNEESLAFVIVSIIWFLLGELHPKKVQETSIYFCNLTCGWLTKCSESPVCGLQS